MIDRDKIIKGLEYCQSACVPDDCECCPFGECSNAPHTLRITPEVHDAILSLLKAQEPRVMTLEEVESLPYGHVMIETDKSGLLRWLDALLFSKNANFSFDFITLEGRVRLLGTEYNREWRCWTSRPTDEQMEVTPWN